MLLNGDSADVCDALTLHSQKFQTAQGINFSLRNLYFLLAKNQISTRRAAILAYISSLLLRTLPAIDLRSREGNHEPRRTPRTQTRRP